MLIKIVGCRSLNFTGNDGNIVNGKQYAYLFEDSRIDGYWIDKFFVGSNNQSVPSIAVGHDYDVQCYFRSSRLDLSTLKLIK